MIRSGSVAADRRETLEKSRDISLATEERPRMITGSIAEYVFVFRACACAFCCAWRVHWTLKEQPRRHSSGLDDE
jgi:hypothetical protein